MPISLLLEDEIIKVKILPGSSWSKDLSKIKSIKGAKWKPQDDKTWHIPEIGLESIFSKWNDTDLIIKSKEILDLSKSLDIDSTPLGVLPQIEGPLEFSRAPQDYQEQYVRLNRS